MERRQPHAKLEKVIAGKKVMYPVAVNRKKVKYIYVKKARRRFKLLPEDGVSDEDFSRA